MVIEGDCVEEMAKLGEASVDAIVCDPPYGLEFMGKEWDRLIDKRDTREDRGFENDGAGGRTTDPYLASKVTFVGGTRAQEWHQAWATEALRVLKPGGHLLAFGGTRTYHRLACAIEDAGFEIRDSLAWQHMTHVFCQCGALPYNQDAVAYEWLPSGGGAWPGCPRCGKPLLPPFAGGPLAHCYGSGFPKSLDVSKAIDKAAGAERTEVVGTRHRNVKPYDDEEAGWNANNTTGDHNYTAPATPEAAQWEGWGTALKPGHEPIVMARKPLIGTVAQTVTQFGTGALNIDGCRIGTEGGTTRSHQADFQSEGKEGEVHATRGYRTGHKVVPLARGAGRDPGGISGNNGADSGGSDGGGTDGDMAAGSGPSSSGNLDGRWPANVLLSPEAAEELDEQGGERVAGGFPSSRSAEVGIGPSHIYGEAAGTQRDKRINLDSGGASRFFATFSDHGLSEGGGRTERDVVKREGSATSGDRALTTCKAARMSDHAPLAESAKEAFADCLRQGMNKDQEAAVLRLYDAMSTNEMEEYERPDDLPHCDCGVEHDQSCTSDSSASALNPESELCPTCGTNCNPIYGPGEGGLSGAADSSAPSSSGDQGRSNLESSGGSAESRFRYCAKASRGERNAGLDGFEEQQGGALEGNADPNNARKIGARPDLPVASVRNSHPTVKPIDLMRWLVRLVTPPGGTVLDPFTGSGTTGIAAVLEGFDFIGIEREPEYVEIARARIAFWEPHAGRTTEEVLAETGVSERVQREHREAGQLGLLE